MRLFLLFVFIPCLAITQELTSFEDLGKFSGHVSRINKTAKLMRLRVRFSNAKYLRKKDRVEFWNETYPNKKCMAYVEGRSPDYVLLKVPKYYNCISRVHLTTGTYLHLYSHDLKKNIDIGESLVSVLMKKKFALQSRMKRFRNHLDGHVNRVDAVNKRYEVLRQKLELEWKHELSALEEDKVTHYKAFKDTKSRLNDLLFKLEQYKVFDENLTLDRWSLDKDLYLKK